VVGPDPVDRQRFLQALQQSLQADLASLMASSATRQRAITEQAHKVLSAARMLEAPDLMAACEALEASWFAHCPGAPAAPGTGTAYVPRGTCAGQGLATSRYSGRQPSVLTGRLRGVIT
jgi:hypothetical protein